tara:strand:+ start:123 stop:302 length:180 start_codon:yes stop_codon:yes gene_type:complete
MADYTKKMLENSFKDTKTSHIVECLREDMEMLRDGRWFPDGDSIDSHMDYIEELARRVK